MLLTTLIVLPVAAGIVCFFLKSAFLRRSLWVATAAAHLTLAIAAGLRAPLGAPTAVLALDELGVVFLSVTSLLFFLATIYGVGYLAREDFSERRDFVESLSFSNTPETAFVACLLFFLAAMTFITTTPHLGVLWVAIEATTLTSAPLIYFHRHRRSLEATWKYLLLCSIGIALALLGYTFLSVSAYDAASPEISMSLGWLIERAPRLHTQWLKAAFILFFIGYGTKMGLVPLHTWLPDAHSEAPSLVSALLSGALLNCAFLGILRVFQICAAAGQTGFATDLFLLFGLLSMGFAGALIVGQTDFKRLLAYSSVEHMGILALGIGLGGEAVFGTILHLVNHSLTKAMLFLVAGNILAVYKTKLVSEVRGVLRVTPISGFLWLLGLFAITGTPPFGIFLSEFTILKAAVDQGRMTVAFVYLAILSIIFVAMARVFLRMAFGTPSTRMLAYQESWLSIAPPVVLALLVTVSGVYLPPLLLDVLRDAATLLGGP